LRIFSQPGNSQNGQLEVERR